MRINGILETALYVADPAVTAAFDRRLFGFTTLLESERIVALIDHSSELKCQSFALHAVSTQVNLVPSSEAL
jgi:hypothetical protein